MLQQKRSKAVQTSSFLVTCLLPAQNSGTVEGVAILGPQASQMHVLGLHIHQSPTSALVPSNSALTSSLHIQHLHATPECAPNSSLPPAWLRLVFLCPVVLVSS